MTGGRAEQAAAPGYEGAVTDTGDAATSGGENASLQAAFMANFTPGIYLQTEQKRRHAASVRQLQVLAHSSE